MIVLLPFIGSAQSDFVKARNTRVIDSIQEANRIKNNLLTKIKYKFYFDNNYYYICPSNINLYQIPYKPLYYDYYDYILDYMYLNDYYYTWNGYSQLKIPFNY